MKDVNGDNGQIVWILQDQAEYLLEKVATTEEIATEENGGKSPVFRGTEKTAGLPGEETEQVSAGDGRTDVRTRIAFTSLLR